MEVKRSPGACLASGHLNVGLIRPGFVAGWSAMKGEWRHCGIASDTDPAFGYGQGQWHTYQPMDGHTATAVCSDSGIAACPCDFRPVVLSGRGRAFEPPVTQR